MASQLRDLILYWDDKAEHLLNMQWNNDVLDAIVPFFRNPWFWAPLYLFLLIFIPLNYRVKGWLWCLFFLLSFALADQISVSLVKPFFHRLRPCNNPSLQGMVHVIVECGSGYSFPSAHATNHFAMGIFSAITLGKKAKWVWPVAIFWAGLVAYSQVYVGVHYPVDVTGGALLGTAIGIITGTVFNRTIGLQKISVAYDR